MSIREKNYNSILNDKNKKKQRKKKHIGQLV
jgi:hypothetical protein